MQESSWGDVYGQTKQAWQGFLKLEWQRQRDRFSGWGRYERRRGSNDGIATATTDAIS